MLGSGVENMSSRRHIWNLVLLSLGLAGARVFGAEPAATSAIRPETVASEPGGTNAAGENSALGDALEFLNGDLLRGTFQGYEQPAGIRWQHAAMPQALTVRPVGVARIRLSRPAPPPVAPAPNCRVSLANGDDLAGTLVGFDQNKLTLNTWYAGTLSLARENLKSMLLSIARNPVVYEGPHGSEGWLVRNNGGTVFFPGATVGGGRIIVQGGNLQLQNGQIIGGKNSGWQFVDDGFMGVSGGTLGRDVKLPPISNFEFDLTYRSTPQLAVYFYSDALEGYNCNAYVMQFTGKNVYLRRQMPNGGGHNLGNAEIGNLKEKGRVRFSIRTNREQKTIALLVDGVLVKQWSDVGSVEGNGTGVLFMAQGQNPIRLSHVRVAEWDGMVEEQAAEANPKEDFVYLANRDKVTGTLLSVQNGKATFKTSFANLEVPLERIVRVDFGSAHLHQLQAAPGEVRLQLRDQGSLTVALNAWNAREIAATSRVFGAARLNANAFQAVEFNLDQQRTDTEAIETGSRNSFFDLFTP